MNNKQQQIKLGMGLVEQIDSTNTTRYTYPTREKLEEIHTEIFYLEFTKADNNILYNISRVNQKK